MLPLGAIIVFDIYGHACVVFMFFYVIVYV